MPRQARLDAPGLLHHIIARGIERRTIFIDKTDYQNFLDRLEISLLKSPNTILAWTLMPNHFHLLVRSGPAGVPSLMRRLMTGYAVTFNRRHRRAGHLFQNRYKSIICEEEPYLLELVRYIHLNPLRAGLVSSLPVLARYPYTGHSAILGAVKRPWQAIDEVLERFSRAGRSARRRYEEFVGEARFDKRRPELVGGGLVRSLGGWKQALQARREGIKERADERILGSGGFVESVLARLEGRALPRILMTMEELSHRVAEAMGVKRSDLLAKGRTQVVSHAKAVLIHLGVDGLDRSVREMGELTKMSGPSASVARGRGREWISEHRDLSKLLN